MIQGVQTIMLQLLSEPKVRAYANPGTIYSNHPARIGLPSAGGMGYKTAGAPNMGMGAAVGLGMPPPQMGMPPMYQQSAPYGTVNQSYRYIFSIQLITILFFSR